MKLISVTEGSFFEAMKVCRAGYRIGDIGAAVENFVISNGFSVVRDYVGHGVGQELHEEPEIPNFGRGGHGARLYPGMTLAIEPMVNVGTHEVRELPDGWTVLTADNSLSAHYENTIAITEQGVEILTKLADV
jgi:methionyl aminopeptidase